MGQGHWNQYDQLNRGYHHAEFQKMSLSKHPRKYQSLRLTAKSTQTSSSSLKHMPEVKESPLHTILYMDVTTVPSLNSIGS